MFSFKQYATSAVFLFFNIRHFKKNIQNIQWTCLNIQVNCGLRIYFLFLHIKIKTVQKISQFNCFHYTSVCFHAVVTPTDRFYITFKCVVLWKLLDIKITRNHSLNGNKRPIRYEFHNGVKPNRYNRNMA